MIKREPLHSKSNSTFSRRDFLHLLKIMGLEAILFAIGGNVYMRDYEPSWVEVNEVSLTLPHLARSFSGFRVAQISDLHYGGWMNAERLMDILRMVKDQSPDLVTITGDFVMGDDHLKQAVLGKLDELAGVLKTLSASIPTVGSLGNHDYWLDRTAVVKMLNKAGIKSLNNSVHTIARGDDKLHFAGVDDVMEHHARLDWVLFRLSEDGCAVLLAHEPDYADVSARTGRFDLQISGHSHGGQVVLPFIGPPILPYLGHKYSSGLYRVMDMYQYTNRGVGMTTPYVRFNCRPEITVFTLEAA
jgi:predicted MPP superfamily phosphohydrolase